MLSRAHTQTNTHTPYTNATRKYPSANQDMLVRMNFVGTDCSGYMRYQYRQMIRISKYLEENQLR